MYSHYGSRVSIVILNAICNNCFYFLDLMVKRLKIRNFGPLAQADVSLLKKNLIIGLQSSGKSCVLKTACFCSWVEKRIELAQSEAEFQDGSRFIDTLVDYYDMRDFIEDDTFIEYETDQMWFSYNHGSREFSFKWNKGRWNYRRPKISYVPSGRNLVAVIPMWSKLPLGNGNLLDFMAEWNVARNAISYVDNVLELGLSYRYEAESKKDSIVMSSGKRISLSQGSSGAQSLLPMFVHLSYLFESNSYRAKDSMQNYEQKEEEKRLLQLLAKYANEDEIASSHVKGDAVVHYNGASFFFENPQKSAQFVKLLSWYLRKCHNEIFLEEPEDNLFPPTQCRLVDWLLEKSSQGRSSDILFVATHSPYVLNQFIKSCTTSFRLFITHPDKNGRFSVKTLSADDIHDVYDNGVDLFFNFEAYL